ncbi:MAG: SMI1/KNR4 family protein [Planctomycetales bacterium]
MKDGEFPLSRACGGGSLPIVQLLLSCGVDLEARSPHYCDTPLFRACETVRVQIVRELLKAGADPNTTNRHKETPLLEILSEGTPDRLAIAEALIQFGADVNSGSYPRTPLMVASKSGSLDMLRLLLKSGAEIDAQARCGTALTIAIVNNRPDVVRVLLESGASLEVGTPDDYRDDDQANMTPIQLAETLKRRKIISILKPDQPIPPVPDVKTIWTQIQARFPEVQLRPGAASQQIDQLESDLGVKFPADFRESYLLHDGQAEDGAFISGGGYLSNYYEFLSLERIGETWRHWQEMLDELVEFQDFPINPDEGVQAKWWHEKWIPIADNGGGDVMCVDLEPDAGGRVGQVVSVDHESNRRRVAGDSVSEWLHGMLDVESD